MLARVLFLILSLAFCATSCKDQVATETAPPVNHTWRDMPYFNQVYTRFHEPEIQCLIDQWHQGIFHEEKPVVFRVINDDSTYRAFFACRPELALPPIEFYAKTLLIGMNAESIRANEAPVKISHIQQRMTRDPNNDPILHVTVHGKKGQGGEWYGFTALIPKTKRKVTLDLRYAYEGQTTHP